MLGRMFSFNYLKFGGIAIVALGAAYYIHNSGVTSERLKSEKSVVAAKDLAMSQTLSNFEGVIHAQEARTQDAKRIKAKSDAARNDLERLQHTIQASTGLPYDSNSPQDASRSTEGALLGQCAQEYLEMARVADEHAADALMLHKAWGDLLPK